MIHTSFRNVQMEMFPKVKLVHQNLISLACKNAADADKMKEEWLSIGDAGLTVLRCGQKMKS